MTFAVRQTVRLMGAHARCIGAAVSAMAVAGCTATLPGPISLGTLPSIGALPAPDGTLADNAPTAVYAAIAQKALVCWMGPKGQFKATHIFHADAASPTTGGQAEIVLHERDLTQKHPWGPRTFRIALTPEGGDTNTRVEMQNIKMKRDMADALRTDVIAWARGKDSCQAQVVQPPAPEPVAAPPKVKKKAKAG